MKGANCTVPWMPIKTKICRDHTSGKKAMDIYKENKHIDQTVCPFLCTRNSVSLDPPTISDYWYSNTTAVVKLQFQDAIKTSEEYYLHNELSLFANIGGLLGLMLGISLVNVRDLINRLFEYIK